jgi:hypothetical protein
LKGLAVYGWSGWSNAATASALSPTVDSSIALAAIYTQDAIKKTTGILYTKLADTNGTIGTPAGPADIGRFDGNSALSAGAPVA